MPIRETSTAPRATATAWTLNGSAVPSVKNRAPSAGPTSWLTVTKPAISRALAMPRSALSTSIGASVPDVVSAKTSAVPSRNIATMTRPMPTWPVTMTTQRADQHDGAGGVHGHHQHPAVEPVGQRPGDEPEQQPRELEGDRRAGHEERVVGLRGDEQRAGGHHQAVAEVARPRRGEQPAEAPPHPGGDHGLDESPHEGSG